MFKEITASNFKVEVHEGFVTGTKKQRETVTHFRIDSDQGKFEVEYLAGSSKSPHIQKMFGVKSGPLYLFLDKETDVSFLYQSNRMVIKNDDMTGIIFKKVPFTETTITAYKKMLKNK